MLLKLLTVSVIIGFIAWEIVKLYRDPELKSGQSASDDEQSRS